MKHRYFRRIVGIQEFKMKMIDTHVSYVVTYSKYIYAGEVYTHVIGSF